MTKVRIDRRNGKYSGFCCDGHTGYASEGEDIVCAGVSAIVINTVNCLEDLLQEDIKITSQEDFDNYLKTMKIKGLGGTDFRPVFGYVNWLLEKKEFTDAVYAAYVRLARDNPKRIAVIDGDRAIEAVEADTRRVLRDVLAGRQEG